MRKSIVRIMLLIIKGLSLSSLFNLLRFAFCFLLEPSYIEVLDVLLQELDLAFENALLSSSYFAVVDPRSHISHVDSFHVLYVVGLNVFTHGRGYLFVVRWYIKKLKKLF